MDGWGLVFGDNQTRLVELRYNKERTTQRTTRAMRRRTPGPGRVLSDPDKGAYFKPLIVFRARSTERETRGTHQGNPLNHSILLGRFSSSCPRRVDSLVVLDVTVYY